MKSDNNQASAVKNTRVPQLRDILLEDQKYLRKDLSLKWKTIRHQDAYVNTEVNISLRRQFALQMAGLLEKGKTILNFDESILDGTTG